MSLHRFRLLAGLSILTVLASGQATFDSSAVAKKIAPAVVEIRGRTDAGDVVGSGVIVAPDGKIITNLHVIRSLKAGAVRMQSGEIFDSFSVLAFDARRDLAVIKVAGFALPVATLADSNDVQVGEPVLLVGNPEGLQGTVTAGVVSAIREDENGSKMLQTDAAANPGNSGGPLCNRSGEVLGILTSGFRDAQNLSFAVPINYARGLLGSLQTPFNLAELQRRLGAAQNLFSETTAFPARWKSLEGDGAKLVRVDGDHVYIEAVIPDVYKLQGFFAIAQFTKSGDKYEGTNRRGIACNYSIEYAHPAYHQCVFQDQAEILSLQPNRIDARIFAPENVSRFNCRKCEYPKNTKMVWHQFTLIPE